MLHFAYKGNGKQIKENGRSCWYTLLSRGQISLFGHMLQNLCFSHKFLLTNNDFEHLGPMG